MKVELHIHLEGAVRPSTVWDLAKKSGVDVPGNNAEELAHFIRSFKMGSLSNFLQTFNIFLPVLVAEKDAIKRVVYELCEDKAKEGVIYFELRLSPHLLANCGIAWLSFKVEKKLPLRTVMQSVIEGIEAGQRDFNIKTRLILTMTKHEPGWAAECLEMAKEFSGSVVGIDIGGEENLPLDPEIIRVYQEAKQCGLHRTVHAGEAGPARHVKEAIEVLHAERIGHGYHCLDDENVYQMVKDKNIHIEACPTSSIFTGACDPDFTKHPCVRFLKDNVNFSLNTDDPLIFGNTMNEEFKIAKEYFAMSDQQAAQVTLNAARSSFLPDGEKEELIKQIESAYKDCAGLNLTV
ncbi:adenosine deaminase-like isoform X1 [Asterias rubens]|uniref:adenosine deaminase-like isoform X1 n=2 Tax=Asterias rubens TaxID=7604 RepID=UPI0014556CC7|nr:adenosine deaminase-like isoform X1 [Asterias rubens]